ncbi:MAG: SCO family protein [Acidimicrobiales bacterium]|nr:SCO family protein [Acidimicrobiales bacterium]
MRTKSLISKYLRRAVMTMVTILSAATLVSCSSSPPPPSANAGLVENVSLPTSIADATLIDQNGKVLSLSSFSGKIVMLVPFLTLCQEVCPLTAGILLQIQSILEKDSLTSKVEIVELSLDPGRDVPSRLKAYSKLVGANWELVTESKSNLALIAKYFGFYYKIVPEPSPPGIDWLTGKPLTYDVEHSDAYVLIDGKQNMRFVTGASPDFTGTINPTLKKMLDKQGLNNLSHPQAPGWTLSSALSSISWLLGQSINAN